MSRLEKSVKPVLTPMIEGRPIEIDAVGVRLLRVWAAKMALNFAYAGERSLSNPIPRGLARDLYAGHSSGNLPAGAEVWTAGYDQETFAYRHMLSLSWGAHPSTGALHWLLRVVFIAGHAAFYVRLPDSIDARTMARRPSPPAFMPLFEPRLDRAVRWPFGSLDDAGVSETFNRHINVGLDEDEDRSVWLAPSGANNPTTVLSPNQDVSTPTAGPVRRATGRGGGVEPTVADR